MGPATLIALVTLLVTLIALAVAVVALAVTFAMFTLALVQTWAAVESYRLDRARAQRASE